MANITLTSTTSSFGVTDTGFQAMTLNNVIDDMQNLLNTIKDPDTSETLEVNFDENDPFIQVMNVFADLLATAWDAQQLTYNQFNPNAASGETLSALVQLNGLTRKSGTPSTVSLTLTGTPGILIPADSEVSDSAQDVIWIIPTDTILDSITGIATVTAESKTNGVYTADAGTINTILTPIAGWTAVINAGAATAGTADETDAALRIRREASTSEPAQSIIEAIYASIINLDGVTYCRAFQNNTLVTNGDGLPAKSLAVVVVGGDNDVIAAEIFKRMPVACYTYGNTSVTYTDTLQMSTTISFTRPTTVRVYVNVDITVTDTDIVPDDVDDLIKSNIITFAASGMSGLGISTSEGFDDYGFPPGTDVIVSKLYSPINIIPGLKINSIETSTDGMTFGTSDIDILWNQIAGFASADIVVTLPS